jgi:hypothetical protein
MSDSIKYMYECFLSYHAKLRLDGVLIMDYLYRGTKLSWNVRYDSDVASHDASVFLHKRSVVLQGKQ